MRRVPLEVNILFHQVSEWCCELCELGNEWRHVCRYPQELLQTRLVCRSWCISDVFHSFRVGVNPFASYTMPKKWILSCPMAHVSLLNASPFSRATYIKLCRCLSCSLRLSVHSDVICDSKCSWAFLQDLVHPLLENVLGHH